MNASQLQFCLEKAGQCDDAASAAKDEHVQAIYRALAYHWREVATEIELSATQQSGLAQADPSEAPLKRS